MSAEKEDKSQTLERASELLHLARALRASLMFHQHCGMRHYPISALASDKSSPATQAAIAPFPKIHEQSQAAAPPERPWPSSVVAPESNDRQRAIRACCACPLGQQQGPRCEGKGNEQAALMILGDYRQGVSLRADHVFGEEEDALLWKMLAAIGLDASQVYVSNALKCALTDGQTAPPAWLKACSIHLECELDMLRPQCICAMGELAAKALLPRSTSIARLRGAWHNCSIPQSKGFKNKILVTYHPRFLLRHPDMKAAAWQDLQMLRRALNTAAIAACAKPDASV